MSVMAFRIPPILVWLLLPPLASAFVPAIPTQQRHRPTCPTRTIVPQQQQHYQYRRRSQHLLVRNARPQQKQQDDETDDEEEESKGWFRMPFSRSSGDDNTDDTEPVPDEDSGGFLRSIKDRFRGNSDDEDAVDSTNKDDKKKSKKETKKKKSKRVKGQKEEPLAKPVPLLFSASKSGPLGSLNTNPTPQQKEEEDKRKQKELQLKKQQEQLQKKELERQRKEAEQNAKRKGKSKPPDDQTDTNESDSSDDGIFSKITGFFSSSSNSTNTTTTTKSKTFRLRSNSTSDSTISVAQTFLTNWVADRLGTSSSLEKEEWIVVCPKARLQPGEIVPVEAAGIDLIIVASKDGQRLYAMENSCPHLGTPLETGNLERRPVPVQLNIGGKPLQFPPTPTNNLLAAPPDQEAQVAALLANDGCEDCIVCPLHKTAFALQSGQVRGEWCPYPPVLGKVMATVKTKTSAAIFDVRTRGKNIEVRLNTPLQQPQAASDETNKNKKKDAKSNEEGQSDASE